MSYEFLAQSMLIFTVTLKSGLIKNVEFDECGPGAYSYTTDNSEVAEAIRRHTLTKQGVIIDTSVPEEEQQAKVDEEKCDDNSIHFDNITKAKTYLAKTYGVDTRKLKTPDSVKDKAKELGIEIDF